MARKPGDRAQIATARAFENAIEPRKEPAERPAARPGRVEGPQQQRAHRRGEREGADGGKNDCHGQRQGELLVELTCEPTDECDPYARRRCEQTRVKRVLGVQSLQKRELRQQDSRNLESGERPICIGTNVSGDLPAARSKRSEAAA